MRTKDYDTTLARMAGNIAAGIIGAVAHTWEDGNCHAQQQAVVRDSVMLARAIVDEVRRTEPKVTTSRAVRVTGGL